MELATIEMSQTDARLAFREYRTALQHRYKEQRWELEELIRKEDRIVMQTYRQLAMGKRLINARETIELGGRDEHDRPKLAIARADQTHARLVTERVGSERRWFICGEQATNERRWHHDHPRGYCFDVGAAPEGVYGHFSAVVPLIPAPLRPDANLANYHILWEAEWRKVAPRDPALLKHVGGDVFAVVAVWDLTEVERLALGIRVSQMRG